MKKILLVMALIAISALTLFAATQYFSSNIETNSGYNITANGDITATGTIYGNYSPASGSTLTISGGFVTPEQYSIIPLVSSGIAINSVMVKIATGTAFTSTATPFISTAAYATGTWVILIGSGSAITLQDQDTLAKTGLELKNSTRVIKDGSVLVLQLCADTASAAGKAWRERFYTDSADMNDQIGGNLTVGKGIAVSSSCYMSSIPNLVAPATGYIWYSSDDYQVHICTGWNGTTPLTGYINLTAD